MPSFLETPRFPIQMARQLAGGPGFSTAIVEVFSGNEQRAGNWSRSRGQWTGDGVVLDEQGKNALLDFFQALGGPLVGFRYHDPVDFSDAGRGYLGSGVGAGVPSYQLVKRYAAGALSRDRDIRKPVAGSISIKRNGAGVAFGAAAGQVALDTTTGVVTFVADASSGISSITPGATTAVTLSAAVGLSSGQRLYVSGLSGTLGSALNGQSWPISSVSGSIYTLSANTAGLSGSGGTGAKYPQSSDVLTWTGQFDVPVRFGSDRLQLIAEGGRVYTPQGLLLLELRT